MDPVEQANKVRADFTSGTKDVTANWPYLEKAQLSRLITLAQTLLPAQELWLNVGPATQAA